MAAFTEDSVWKYLLEQCCHSEYEDKISYHKPNSLHRVSLQCSYRKVFKIKGQMIDDNKIANVCYTFYARDKDSKYGLNWIKIENDLKASKILKHSDNNILNFNWIKAKDLSKFIMLKVKKDPYYLVHKN